MKKEEKGRGGFVEWNVAPQALGSGSSGTIVRVQGYLHHSPVAL